MHVIAWNISHLPTFDAGTFSAWLADTAPDILCLQGEAAWPLAARHPRGYHAQWLDHCAILSRETPQRYQKGLGLPRFDSEGRLLIAAFGGVTLVNAHLPTGTRGRADWFYKLAFLYELRDMLELHCAEQASIILCAALYIAHQPRDTAQPDLFGPSYTAEERAWVDELLALGFVDTFRAQHPEQPGYTWTTPAGRRVEYIFSTPDLADQRKSATILAPLMAAPSQPISLTLY